MSTPSSIDHIALAFGDNRQPVKSWPLKSAVKPGGGLFSALADSAPVAAAWPNTRSITVARNRTPTEGREIVGMIVSRASHTGIMPRRLFPTSHHCLFRSIACEFASEGGIKSTSAISSPACFSSVVNQKDSTTK